MATKVEKALANCDGVIKIAENEMLLQGEYITEVVDTKLRKEGAICGGRKACLVGSMFLAHGRVPSDDRYIFNTSSWGGSNRFEYMAKRPALRLTYDAFNEAARRRIKRDHPDHYGDGEYWEPTEGWGENYFETVLQEKEHNEVRRKVITLARDAKRLIKTGAVS